MAMNSEYAAVEPTRDEINGIEGPVLIEFGAPWCGYCLAAQPLLARALDEHPQVRHIKIEDGKGRPLGRSFRVTLWPTLVLMKDGAEIARLVRPGDAGEIGSALALLSPKA